MEQSLIWFSQKLTKNAHRFLKFLSFYPLYDFQILVHSDLSIDSVVWLGSTEKKDIQDAVKKVLVLLEEWKYPNFCGKFLAFSRNLLDKWYSYHYISLAPFIVLF